MEKEETYADAIRKLQMIYGELKSGKTSVDTLSEKVKEASRLIKICRDRIYKVDENVAGMIEKI
jgi:exodeoxyribonuclease VII small subunit